MRTKIQAQSALAIAAVAVLTSAGTVAAANEIGSVVATTGRVEVRRASAGDWKNAARGAPVYSGDEVRTDSKGKAKLFFRDESVLDIGKDSSVAIKRYDLSGSGNVVELDRGEIRVFLSESMSRGATFEVETPTAVIRATGTVFLVRHDTTEQATRVYGIEGLIDVQGAIGLIGPSLKIGASQNTRIAEGKFPEPAQATDSVTLETALAGLEIIGTGGVDSYAATHPLLAGAITRSDERPSQIAVSPSAAAGVSYLAPTAPGETMLHRLSPAARANTQPIPEYLYLNGIGQSP